jgi:hypothetical protein
VREHPAEIIARGWTLDETDQLVLTLQKPSTCLHLKNTANAINSHPDQIFLLLVVFVDHLDEDLETAAADEHLQLSERISAQGDLQHSKNGGKGTDSQKRG